MVLSKNTSEDGPDSPVEYGTRRGSLNQARSTETWVSQAALGGGDGEPFVTRAVAAGGVIQEMIKAAQVGERYLDLRHRSEFRGPRLCAMRLAQRQRGFASAGSLLRH